MGEHIIMAYVVVTIQSYVTIKVSDVNRMPDSRAIDMYNTLHHNISK